MRNYLLDGHRAYPVDTDTPEGLIRWARAFEALDRQVALDRLPLATVSTVFLGLDHNHWHDGPPLLFETMIFVHEALKGGPLDDYQTRCSTWEQAEAMHREAMAELLKAHQEAAG